MPTNPPKGELFGGKTIEEQDELKETGIIMHTLDEWEPTSPLYSCCSKKKGLPTWLIFASYLQMIALWSVGTNLGIAVAMASGQQAADFQSSFGFGLLITLFTSLEIDILGRMLTAMTNARAKYKEGMVTLFKTGPLVSEMSSIEEFNETYAEKIYKLKRANAYFHWAMECARRTMACGCCWFLSCCKDDQYLMKEHYQLKHVIIGDKSGCDKCLICCWGHYELAYWVRRQEAIRNEQMEPCSMTAYWKEYSVDSAIVLMGIVLTVESYIFSAGMAKHMTPSKFAINTLTSMAFGWLQSVVTIIVLYYINAYACKPRIKAKQTTGCCCGLCGLCNCCCKGDVNENDKLDSLLSSEETNNANYGSQPKDSENPYGSAPSLIDVVR